MSSWLLALPWIGVLWLVLRRYATRSPRLWEYGPRPGGPRLSVIIPARNEAANIERCVRSILAAGYDPLEIIVVDDRSTDGTAGIAEWLAAAPEARARVRVIRGTEPPAEWFGKQWAIHQGYGVASGELLLFADADTRHEPELIPRAVAALQAERVDLFSVLPRQEVRTFWERLIQPHVFFALGARVGDLRKINRTRVVWNAIANGQFILTPRAAYEAVGTHEAVKHSVADDMMLAQRYVALGKDIFLAHAQEFMATRMYGSLREIVEGWSKNLALGAPHMLPPVRWLRALAPYFMWVPALFWILPPLDWIAHGPQWGAAKIATIASLLLWVAVYAAEKVPVWYALLYPFGAGMVALIMLRSALRGSKVEWRGRVYGQRPSG